MQDFLSILYPVLLTILTGFLGYIGKEVVKLAPKLIDFVVAKIGLTNYTKSKLVALDIWNIVEEEFRLNELIGDTIQAKQIMFKTLIKQKIPSITDADIELFRQSIAGEINKIKPVILNVENFKTTNPQNIENLAADLAFYMKEKVANVDINKI